MLLYIPLNELLEFKMVYESRYRIKYCICRIVRKRIIYLQIKFLLQILLNYFPRQIIFYKSIENFLNTFQSQTSQIHKLQVINSTVWKGIQAIILAIIRSFRSDDINAIGCQERKMMILKPLSCRRPDFHRLFSCSITFHLHRFRIVMRF